MRISYTNFNKTQIKLNDIRRILHWSILCLALLLLGVGCHSLGGDPATPLGEGEPSSIEDSVNASSEELDKDQEEADNNTNRPDNRDKLENPDSQENQENNKDREPGIIRLIIQTEVLNVRQEPSTESAIVGKALCGEDYDIQDQVVDKSGDTWYEIDKREDVLGWVAAEYVYGVDTYGHYYSRRIPYDVTEEGYIYQEDTLYVTIMEVSGTFGMKEQLHIQHEFYESPYPLEGVTLYDGKKADFTVEDLLNESSRFVHNHKVYEMQEYNALADEIKDHFSTMDYSDMYYAYLDVESHLHLVNRRSKEEVAQTKESVISFRVIEEGVMFSTQEGSYVTLNKSGEWTTQQLSSEVGEQFTYIDGTFWVYSDNKTLLAIKDDMSTVWKGVDICLLTKEGVYQVTDSIIQEVYEDKSIEPRYISMVYLDYFDELDNIWEDNGKLYIADPDDGFIYQVIEYDLMTENLSNIIYENSEGALMHYGNSSYEPTLPFIYYNKKTRHAMQLVYDMREYRILGKGGTAYVAYSDDIIGPTKFIAISMDDGTYKKILEKEASIIDLKQKSPYYLILFEGDWINLYDLNGNKVDTIKGSQILLYNEEMILYNDLDGKVQVYVYDEEEREVLLSRYEAIIGRKIPYSTDNGIHETVYWSDNYFYYINEEHVLERLNLKTGDNEILFPINSIRKSDEKNTNYMWAWTLEDTIIAWKYDEEAPIHPITIDTQSMQSEEWLVDHYYVTSQRSYVKVYDIETGKLVFDKQFNPKEVYDIYTQQGEVGFKITVRLSHESEFGNMNREVYKEEEYYVK